MDTNAIRKVLKQEPFRPFMLRMNDGREYYVAHPEWLMVSPVNVVYVDSSTENIIHLEPMLIASIHMSKPKNPSKPDETLTK